MENYFFDITDKNNEDKVFVLIIYDIHDNKQRIKLSKYLQGFGFRVQKSAFEAVIKEKTYNKMLSGIGKYVDEEDSVRVYKIIGKGQVKTFGKDVEYATEETIII